MRLRCAALSAANSGDAAQRLVLVEQRLVLPELGLVDGDLRQVRVVGVAQLGRRAPRAGAHLAPGAREALVGVLERRDEVVPVGRGIGGSARATAARASASSSSMAGVTCSGLKSAKRGRPEKSSRGFMRLGT